MDFNFDYAKEWNESAQLFWEQGDYEWLSDQLDGFATILELGCGTGQSTLALLEKAHNVIAVDKNPHCLDLAEKKVQAYSRNGTGLVNKKTGEVQFVEADYTDWNFTNQFLPQQSIDAIACWNVGTAGDANVLADYRELWEHFGYSKEETRKNPASVYNSTMCLCACLLGQRMNTPVNIVFRSPSDISCEIIDYYTNIKDEMKFSDVIIKSRKTTSLSSGGRLLAVNNQVSHQKTMDLFLISILLK